MNDMAINKLLASAGFRALLEELEDLRAALRARKALGAWQEESSRGRPYTAVRDELVAEGLLDRE